MKKTIIRFLFISLLGVIFIALTLSWNIKKIDDLIRAELQQLHQKGIPVNVQFQASRLKFIPLEISLHTIDAQPIGELANTVKKINVNEVIIRPSLLRLVFGQIYIDKLSVSGAQLALNIKDSSQTQKENVDVFNLLAKIPILNLELKKIDLQLNAKVEQQSFAIDLKGLDANIVNDRNFLNTSFKINSMMASVDQQAIMQNAYFETRFILTKSNFVLSDFKLKENSTFLVATGTSQIDLKKYSLSKGNFNLRTETSSEKVQFFYRLFTKKSETPFDKFKTMLRADLRLNINSNLDDIIAQTEIALFNFQVEKFRVGNIFAKASYDSRKQNIDIQEARLSNGGITAYTQKTSINLTTFELAPVEVSLKMFKLQDYLQYSLNNKITSNIDATGELKCGGSLDTLKIKCTGDVYAKNIQVNTGSNKPILHFPSASAKGHVVINSQEINYEAEATALSSTGKSSGTINYESGFHINYESSYLNLSEVKRISVLDLEGSAKVSGSTKGNSKSATFEFKADAQDFVLSQFKLGSISSNVHYKQGSLSLKKIQGSIVSSRYLGDLDVNLEDDRLTGKIQFPFIDLAVIQDSIKERLKIPISLSGSGSAIVNINSSLDIKKLSLQSKARLYNCKFAEQHVDNLDLDVIAENGKLQFKSALFEEKSTAIRLSGSMHLGSEEYNLSFSSKKTNTDDIFYTSQYFKKIKGTLSVEGTITKAFNNPLLSMTFTSDEFFYAKKSISPLAGKLTYEKEKTQFALSAADLFSVNFQNSQKAPYYLIEGFTHKMDFAPAITTLLDSEALETFKLLNSSKFNLKIPKQNSESASGYIQNNDLSLTSNSQQLELEKPVTIFLTNGKLNFSPFTLKGSGGRIQVSSTPNSSVPVDVSVSGVFSLSLAHIFVPFLETVEGQTTLTLKIKYGGQYKTEMIGSAYIEDSYIRLGEIPHAVENMNADILFNQDKIIINAINAKFASGTLLGDGSILLAGSKNIPLMLNIYLENINLNIPSDVNTQGKAVLKLTGNWLPFKLSGDYNIFDGNITKEIGGSTETTLDSPYHVFLPTDLRKKTSSPIDLDVNLNIKNAIKIKNKVVDGRLEGQLHIAGIPQQPTLDGKINLIRNSFINFNDVQFTVRDSNIVFTGSTPPNPELYLLANTDFRGYAIELQLLGDANKPKFKFSSQPNLSQQEIISLLALGYTSDVNLQTNLNTPTLNNPTNNNQSNIEVGTALFSQNPLGKEFKDRFGFDVQFSSSFDTANSVASPKISVGKKISEKMIFTGSSIQGREKRADARLRYQINKDIYGTASITSQGNEEANQDRGNQRSDVIGVDLEYRKEFK